MAGQTVANRPAPSFDFVMVDGVSSDVVSTTLGASSHRWIDPATIKLRHRIGRGVFGDVWLAIHHRSSQDHDEYQEVAVKMLHPVEEENIRDVLNRLGDLIFKCQGLDTVCLLYWLSVINKRVWSGSSSGNNGPPCKRDPYPHIGIPYMLLGIPLPSKDMDRRLGNPIYMAPEQWQPEVRGHISVETDSWGFGCSILEMLTGIQPWSGKSVEEINKLVVTKQEKPHIPSGLPTAVENVIIGCFEEPSCDGRYFTCFQEFAECSLSRRKLDRSWK